ncbi:3-hydroxyisobutyrate dehydrogenase [Polynucleobacter kasalickyi]|uniref:3-hydroxyisobutyrate dehydrogenase n=2 Tax=Polynucleobacter kasalickyi TaxID=1938817 RepID=A0A1W2C870_9BURK|nr:3-hydroxyisobutyrate dehydrogenase [Polynucleobacter kasalickyi]
MKILFIGVGKMGLPMSCHLLNQGHDIRVLDPDPIRLQEAAIKGLEVASQANDSVEDFIWADYIFSSLPNDHAFLEVANQVAQKAAKNTKYIDTSTISISASAKAAEILENAGVQYLRVAVSGNNHMAAAANLTILASGPKPVYDEALPLLSSWGSSQFYLGDKEQARLMKLVVNLLIAQTSAMLAEGLTLGRLGNLDWQDMWQVLSASAVGSPILKAKSAQLGLPLGERDFSPTFTVHQMIKDLQLITSAGDDLGASLAQTKTTLGWMNQAIAQGDGGLDYAAIIRVLERQVGITDLS